MKKSIFLIVVFFACVAGALAQSNVMTATAKAEIRVPLTISNDPLVPAGTNALNFGIVSVGTTLGTAVLSTQNVESATGGVSLMSSVATSVASFQITGSVGKTYALTIQTPSVSINGPAGSTAMTVDNFLTRPTSTAADALTGTLDASGADMFKVGGTLHVAANQTEGQYTGSFSISAVYN
jgi:hypothetical protein